MRSISEQLLGNPDSLRYDWPRTHADSLSSVQAQLEPLPSALHVPADHHREAHLRTGPRSRRAVIDGTDGTVLVCATALCEISFETSPVGPDPYPPCVRIPLAWPQCGPVLFVGPESPTSLYSAVVRAQSIVVSLAIILGLIAMQLSIAEVASVIGQSISRKLVGKKKTWWNRPLKGTWMWGIFVGFAVGILIASTFLRWALLAVAVLGIIFAALFRALRKQDEI